MKEMFVNWYRLLLYSTTTLLYTAIHVKNVKGEMIVSV